MRNAKFSKYEITKSVHYSFIIIPLGKQCVLMEPSTVGSNAFVFSKLNFKELLLYLL